MEKTAATRLSLLQSVLKRGKTEQLGDLQSPLSLAVNKLRRGCLTGTAISAREADELQVALNCVVQAQTLERPPSLDVMEEFANVLWNQEEKKLATEILGDLIGDGSRSYLSPSKGQRARVLARMVSNSTSSESGHDLSW